MHGLILFPSFIPHCYLQHKIYQLVHSAFQVIRTIYVKYDGRCYPLTPSYIYSITLLVYDNNPQDI